MRRGFRFGSCGFISFRRLEDALAKPPNEPKLSDRATGARLLPGVAAGVRVGVGRGVTSRSREPVERFAELRSVRRRLGSGCLCGCDQRRAPGVPRSANAPALARAEWPLGGEKPR